jgi:hypothetical protein
MAAIRVRYRKAAPELQQEPRLLQLEADREMLVDLAVEADH